MGRLNGSWLVLRRLVAWALLAGVLGGCPSRPASEHPQLPPSATAPASAVSTAADPGTRPVQSAAAPTPDAAELEQRAEQMMAEARAAEPTVTAMLQSVATDVGGELTKLKYRLKAKPSIIRKMRLRLAADPSLTIQSVVLDDTLRYTLQVADDPPGRHVAAVRQALAAIESKGHQLVRLKNYWPEGDSYSGCNGSLRTPDGLLWELQFHTPESAATADRTRDWYEELRRTDTPLARKQELFDMMCAEWAKVPVPKGILERDALHPMVEILDRPRP